MAEWLEFEELCTEYLNCKFGDKANFYHLGSADSTVSDIRVVTKTGREFYMDAKLTPAQCGQFVLLPDVANGCFVFSKKNKTESTPQVQAIIRHMDADFEAYKEAGTRGKEIDLGDGGKIFTQWIISMYLQKGTKFFITNDYTIVPVCDFAKYFDVTAKYRTKRSGSRAVGVNSIKQMIRQIVNSGFPVDDYRVVDGRLLVRSSAQLQDRRFLYNGSECLFSKREGEYEVRILSNTFNANVIFSIIKKPQKGLTDLEFAQCLD